MVKYSGLYVALKVPNFKTWLTRGKQAEASKDGSKDETKKDDFGESYHHQQVTSLKHSLECVFTFLSGTFTSLFIVFLISAVSGYQNH